MKLCRAPKAKYLCLYLLAAILLLTSCGAQADSASASASTEPSEAEVNESFVSETDELPDAVPEKADASDTAHSETASDSVAGSEDTASSQAAELTEDDITLLIEPFQDLVYTQEKSFSSLPVSLKAEVCAMVAVQNGAYTYSDDGPVISKRDIAEIMDRYFGQPCEITSDMNTDYFEVQGDSVLFSCGEWGGTKFDCEIASISKLDKNTYSAAVLYRISTEALETALDYCTVTYFFEHNEENGYYISDCSLDYQFIGWDAVDLLGEEAASNERAYLYTQIVDHYTELWEPSGTYSCSDFDFEDTGDEYIFVLRYAMSDEEAEERIADGGMVSANVYVTTIWVNKSTGEVRDEFEDECWYLNLP